MTDLSDSVVHALRTHIAERRASILSKFPKHLKQEDYIGLCGMHQEVEMFANALQAAVQKANAPDEPVDDNEGGYT